MFRPFHSFSARGDQSAVWPRPPRPRPAPAWPAGQRLFAGRDLLHQERKVNPLGGCLPIALQLPIFLVLYYTIRQFDKLDSFRTGGLFWFTDLTVSDPLFILPVAYVLTMMASQELAMRNTVAKQKQIVRFMPLVFGFFAAVQMRAGTAATTSIV